MNNLAESQTQYEPLLNFPDTRYMGSKRKLIPSLFHIFNQLKFKSALDAFSGTSSVAYLLKSMGKAVDTNDYLRFNYYISKALVENSKVKLSRDEVTEIIQFNSDGRESFIEKEFSGLYYNKKDCRWLDSAIANIEFLTNPYKKAIALTALCRACIKKRPRGIFTYTGMRYDDGRKDLKIELAEHFVNAVEMINNSIISGQQCRAFNQDIMKFKKTQYDLVYFDPPYLSLKSDNEYTRRYHFLEGLVSYWSHVEINRTTKTKKFDRFDSMFTHKDTIVPAFEELFDRHKQSKIVLSYSSNCFPNSDILKGMIRNSGKAVELIEIDYVYSVGTHGHKKNNQSNQVKEYVFLGV